MKERFYELMGFDRQRGIPGPDALAACGMAEEAGQVWPAS
jgi:hypothetical protein